MCMVGRPGIGSRLVLLVTVAATLLAAWMPLARVCACRAAAGPVSVAGGAVTPDPAPAAPCPCCGKSLSPGEMPRPCCLSHARVDKQGPVSTCGCGAWSPPSNPEPAAPPRPGDSDNNHALSVAAVVPAVVSAPVPVGPAAAELAARLTGPPPTDLVISLSRFTC